MAQHKQFGAGIFLDANVALHYRRCDQINWHGLLDVPANMEIALLIAPIFLRELEKHKFNHPKMHLRTRAKESLSWFAQRFHRQSSESIRPNVFLELITCEPNREDFQRLDLSDLVADDWLIASVLLYAQDCTFPLHVATADLPLDLKLSTRRLASLTLPDELRLPERADPDQQELLDLKRELAVLKARTPQLSLVFGSGQSRLEVHDKSPAEHLQSLEHFVEAGLRDIHQKNPKLSRDDRLSAVWLAGLSSEQISIYNAKLERFFKEYEQYLQALWTYKWFHRRAIRLDLLLRNTGQALASEIDVCLTLPAGITAWSSSIVPERPDAPDAPHQPIPFALAGLQRFTSPDLFTGPTLAEHLRALHPVELLGPRVDDHQTTANYWIRQLKHHREISLEPLFVAFPDELHAHSFNIAIDLHSAEMPERDTGRLDIVVGP